MIGKGKSVTVYRIIIQMIRLKLEGTPMSILFFKNIIVLARASLVLALLTLVFIRTIKKARN